MQFLIGGWHAKSLVKEEGKLLLNTYLLNEAHTFMLTGVRYWHKLFKTPVPNYSSKRKRNWNCGEYKSIKSYHQWILCARKMVRNIIVKAIFSIAFFQCLYSLESNFFIELLPFGTNIGHTFLVNQSIYKEWSV